MGVHEIVPFKKQTLTGGEIEPVGRSAFAEQNFKGTAPIYRSCSNCINQTNLTAIF